MRTVPPIALAAFVAAAVLCWTAYAFLGVPKPAADWRWMDIAGEGGTALMAGLWSLLILGSRPRGRVTALLAGGLAAITLGAWVDCLDEFFQVPEAQNWDHWLEALFTPGGMVLLTWGLYGWRQEQWSLNEHMQKRERLFREHRAFDRLTQLADAAYLRRQLHLERERAPERPAALILLDVDDFHRINRTHGAREGDRLLQAISHLLLLNLRPTDLLCRYAGDRYAVLMPDTDAPQAEVMAGQLRRAAHSLVHHTRDGEPLSITLRSAWGLLEDDAQALLDRLDRALESPAPPTAATCRAAA